MNLRTLTLSTALLALGMVGPAEGGQMWELDMKVASSRDATPPRCIAYENNDPTASTGFVEAHTPLTDEEAAQWKQVADAYHAAWKKMNATETALIAAHGLKAKCGDYIAIRTDEDFIFESIPDNPRWEGYEATQPECGVYWKSKYPQAKWLTSGHLANNGKGWEPK